MPWAHSPGTCSSFISRSLHADLCFSRTNQAPIRAREQTSFGGAGSVRADTRAEATAVDPPAAESKVVHLPPQYTATSPLAGDQTDDSAAWLDMTTILGCASSRHSVSKQSVGSAEKDAAYKMEQAPAT